VANSAAGGAGATRTQEREDDVGIYLELSKIRLCTLVVITAGVGYLLGVPEPALGGRFIATLAGTMIAALGANALNQWLEREADARMERTRHRPLPAGRLAPGRALAWGLAASTAGPALLLAVVGALPALLAVVTVLIYVLVYTPLKRLSTLNTLVGAVCGAIPPLIGWSAAAGRITEGGWLLAVVLFLWQMPHFLALAWLYRDDYARGGFVMLPVSDPTGRLTFRVTLIFALMLIPLTLTIFLAGMAGPWFAAGASLLGLLWLAPCWQLLRTGQRADARRVFLASLVYLPLALGLMVADRGPHIPAGVVRMLPGGPAAAAVTEEPHS
jgi:protoheme IX farnesyltransferase